MVMRIKLALLDRDRNYLDRIVSAFEVKYADKFEIYSFTELSAALEVLGSNRIDVFVANESFDIDIKALPKWCGFAYFVNSTGVESVDDQRAICKFQKAELIYKQILSIHSEHAGRITGMKADDDSTKTIIFSSPCGGSGTSAMAAACAIYYARQNKKTLYLNLEKFGSADAVFTAEGYFDMGDIIFALKNKKTNLALKLESSVRQDVSGVCYFSQTKVALDMMELSTDDILRLLSELRFSGAYDMIVVDMDFSLAQDTIQIFRTANALVWVGDGSATSNAKIQRAYNALSIMEQRTQKALTSRLYLIYNKFSNKTSITVGDIGIKNIGGAPRYEHAKIKQVVQSLSTMNMFDNIFS